MKLLAVGICVPIREENYWFYYPQFTKIIIQNHKGKLLTWGKKWMIESI